MKKTLLITAIALCSTAAVAESTGGVGAKISTQGLGLEYSFPVNEQTEISLNANYLNFDREISRNDFDADVTLKLATFGVVGHYYPWDNGFNINGGLYINQNKGEFDAQPTGPVKSYTINGVRYASDQLKDAHGTVDFNKVAPYIGVGWQSGDRNSEGFAFDANLGVMFQGTPSLEFSAKCAGNLARPNDPFSKRGCEELQYNIAKKRQELQDKFNDKLYTKFFPVASVGFIYRF